MTDKFFRQEMLISVNKGQYCYLFADIVITASKFLCQLTCERNKDEAKKRVGWVGEKAYRSVCFSNIIVVSALPCVLPMEPVTSEC